MLFSEACMNHLNASRIEEMGLNKGAYQQQAPSEPLAIGVHKAIF
jgi:hypothetical protein